MTLLLAMLFPLAVRSKADWFRAAFILLDVYVNYTEMTVLFLSFPDKGDRTVTKRLKRLKDTPGWRGDIARWAGIRLNKVDPGHI